MPTTDLLKTFGLSRNPFTDRTAEKANLHPSALYIQSDLQGFTPNETTYIFFGRRGSGKTTIRLQMEAAYRQYNEAAVESGGWASSANSAYPPSVLLLQDMQCVSTFQSLVAAHKASKSLGSLCKQMVPEVELSPAVLPHAFLKDGPAATSCWTSASPAT